MAQQAEAQPVSKEDYSQWRGSHVTKQFLQDLFKRREELKEAIAENSHSNNEDRLIDIGRCQAIKDVIDWALFEFEYIGKHTQDDVATS